MTDSAESSVSQQISEIQRLEAGGNVDAAVRGAEGLAAQMREDYHNVPGDPSFLVESLAVLANLKRDQGDSQAAEALYTEIIEMAQDHVLAGPLLAEVEAGLACVYDFNGREEDSVPFYEDAIRLYEEHGRSLQAGNLANNLAMVHKGLGQYDDAEKNYLKALEIFTNLAGKDHESTAAVYNNLGGLYYTAGYPDQARDMHQEALDIRRNLFGENHSDVAQSYSNLAAVAHEAGQTQKARDYFERATHVLDDLDESHAEDLFITLENYREFCLVTGDDKKAAALQRRMEKL